MPSFGGNPRAALPPPPVLRGDAGTASQGPPPPPVLRGDAGSASQGGAQVNAFKRSPAYKQAIVSVFKAQPPAQQKAIVQGARQHGTPEGKAVLDFIRQTQAGGNPFNIKAGPAISGGAFGPGSRRGISANPDQVMDNGGGGGLSLGAITGALSTPFRLSTALGPLLPLRAITDTVKAAVEKPSVIPATLKGGAELAAGMVAAPVDLALHPSKIPQIPGNLIKDLANRYGALIAGNDQAFINQIKNNPQGAAPELVDALVAAGGLDATLGKAVGAVGRKAGAKAFTEPRPNLLLSGSKTRPQAVAGTAGRVAAQRVEDKLRAARTAGKVPLVGKGELTPGKGQVAPLFQEHAIRVTHSAIAQTWRRTIQENINREVRQGAGGAGAKLSNLQRRFAFLGVQGTVPLSSGVEAARSALEQRMQAIRAQRTANPGSLGNRIPQQHAAAVDELALLREAHQKADKIFTPQFAAWQKGEAARAQRIAAASELHPATSEARALRAQGEHFGIAHPDERFAKAQADLAASKATLAGDNRAAPIHAPGPARPANAGFGNELAAARAKSNLGQFANYERNRPQMLREYSQQVRAAAQKAGLPEPGYFKHQPHPKTDFAAYASGSGAKAAAAAKVSKFTLYKAGVYDHSFQAYLDGLAQSIKRPLQWRLTDEQFKAAALPTPTRTAIQAALGRKVQPASLTGHELRQVLAHSGADLNNIQFYNPGRLAESTLRNHDLLTRSKGHMLPDQHDQQASHLLHEQLNQHEVAVKPNDPAAEKFLATQGWKAVPKTAFDEIHGGLKASSKGGRIVGKVQGTTAGIILGQNPSFLVMNSLAHAFPAIAGTKGGILPNLAKFPLWWHGLDDAQRDVVRAHAGGRAGHYAQTAKLGSQAPSQLAASWRQLNERGIMRAAQTLNPLHAIMKGEDIQSNFFRNAVFYHELKSQAFRNMGHEYGQAVRLQAQLQHVFTVGPKDRMQAILKEMPTVEHLGRTVVNILGDYGRFTNRERQVLNNRAVLFYSFLRHVTRTLLYVLPARHPLALGLLGELSQLHHNEVDKMLGGQDLPWAYSRVFWDHNGHLSSIDFGRTSPVTSPLVDVLEGGVKQLPRLISPSIAPLLDMAYAQTPTGQPVPRNAFSLLHSYLSLSYPYRAGSMAHFGLKAQQADSIPYLHENPRAVKSAAAQAYEQAKEQARSPLKGQMLGSLLGVYPKPDDSKVIAAHRAQQAARKAGGGGASLGGSLGTTGTGDLSSSLGAGGGQGDLGASLR